MVVPGRETFAVVDEGTVDAGADVADAERVWGLLSVGEQKSGGAQSAGCRSEEGFVGSETRRAGGFFLIWLYDIDHHQRVRLFSIIRYSDGYTCVTPPHFTSFPLLARVYGWPFGLAEEAGDDEVDDTGDGELGESE